jgi:hypothetical protein
MTQRGRRRVSVHSASDTGQSLVAGGQFVVAGGGQVQVSVAGGQPSVGQALVSQAVTGRLSPQAARGMQVMVAPPATCVASCAVSTRSVSFDRLIFFIETPS